MKIYHGSCEDRLATILKTGIKPRGKGKGNWKEFPSRPDMVYLTTAYPFYFAMCSLKGRALVLEIETDLLDEGSLYPDEDFVAQVLSHQTGRRLKTLIHDVRDRLEEYQENWRKSVDGLGNCCYKGVIPPSAISRYCLFDAEARPELAAMMLDPAISVMNYRFLGQKYRQLVSWMFGDTARLPTMIDGPAEEMERALGVAYKNAVKANEEESKDRTGIEVVVCQTKPGSSPTK